MRTITCAMVASCLVVMMGSMVFAADQAPKQPLPADEQQIANLAESHNKEEARAWLKSIKPAAGPAQAQQKFRPGTEYWQQSVLRGSRGKMQE